MLLCWTSPGEICCYCYLWICAVLTLTTRCSRTTLLCCILSGEMYCCQYLRTCAVSTQTMRCTIEFAVLYQCWMNPHMSALFTVFLMEKWTGLPKRYFVPKRLFQIFFLFIQHPFCWVFRTSSFVEDISVPCNSWVTQYFLKQFYHCYLIQFFWLVVKIAINFRN